MVPNMIDISSYQAASQPIDFKRVKQSGIKAVIIRAGEGRSVDKKFAENVTGAINAGIPVGIYWFSRAYTVSMAEAEAALCAQTIQSYKIDLPVYFDWEGPAYNDCIAHGVKPTKDLVTQMVLAFGKKISFSNFNPGIYTNPSYLKSYIDTKKCSGYSLWLAQYGVSKPSVSCDMWQYGVGKVDGILGDCDLDILYNDALLPKPETTGFKTGDIVKICKGAKYYGTNIEVPDVILAKSWIVYSVSGEKVILNKSTDGTMQIMSAFYASDLSLANGTSTATPSALKVGDKCKLIKDAPVYGTNQKFAFWVYTLPVYVRAIVGNRVTISILKNGAITGMVDKKYLTR